MNKENIVYRYDGDINFQKKEPANPVNTHKLGGHYINQNKPETGEIMLCGCT